MGKITHLLQLGKGHIVGGRLAWVRYRRRQTSLGSQKQPDQRFSKTRIRTHSPSLEDLTAVGAQFSMSWIGVVSHELYVLLLVRK